MKLRTLRSIYFPLTVPHPGRLRRWVRSIGYNRVRVVAGGEVTAVLYTLPAASPAIAGRRIAFATDFHYGGSARDRHLATLAAERVREFRPDVLCLGGDLSTDAIELDALPELLEKFRDIAPLRLAIPGNWERGKSWLKAEFWESLYEAAGIRYLCNAGVEYEGFYFYGCDELANGSPHLPERWPSGRFPVLLVHRPDTAIALDTLHALEPGGLSLCGHTHAGQVRLHPIGPLYASSRYGCRLAYGLYQRRNGTTRMIVSSGIGDCSFPLRIGCRREVVLIEFA